MEGPGYKLVLGKGDRPPVKARGVNLQVMDNF